MEINCVKKNIIFSLLIYYYLLSYRQRGSVVNESRGCRKKRREQIRRLRSKRAALLKQRDLLMEGRMAAQQDAQRSPEEYKVVKVKKKKTKIVVLYKRWNISKN